MRWVELNVEAGVEAVEAVSEILGRLGRGLSARPSRLLTDVGDELAARPDPGSPYVVTAHIPEDESAAVAIDRTERALWHLQAFGLGPVGALSTRVVDDSEWAAGWKRGYTAQRIGRLMIVPSWEDDVLDAGAAAVRLDPGMAFGTGLHPTTRGCLLTMQELEPMPRRVLDVGCGSGILGLAALRLGAERAVCLDTDPIAVETTTANAAINGMSERVEVRLGTLEPEPTEPFDLIVANIVAGILVELAPRLGRHLDRDGRLIASGIIGTRADEVSAALQRAELRILRRFESEDWVTMLASPR